LITQRYAHTLLPTPLPTLLPTLLYILLLLLLLPLLLLLLLLLLLQSTMLKGCIPTAENAADFYSAERRRRVRRVYLAMIAEFDAMVGEYMRAVDDSGLANRTIFLVTSGMWQSTYMWQRMYYVAEHGRAICNA
jgi:hypothetical protein